MYKAEDLYRMDVERLRRLLIKLVGCTMAAGLEGPVDINKLEADELVEDILFHQEFNR